MPFVSIGIWDERTCVSYARSHNCPMKFVTKCYVVSNLEVGSSDFCRFALHSYYLKNEDDMKLAASLHRFYE